MFKVEDCWDWVFFCFEFVEGGLVLARARSGDRDQGPLLRVRANPGPESLGVWDMPDVKLQWAWRWMWCLRQCGANHDGMIFLCSACDLCLACDSCLVSAWLQAVSVLCTLERPHGSPLHVLKSLSYSINSH